MNGQSNATVCIARTLHAGHAVAYARLRHRRAPVGSIGKAVHAICSTCVGSWPCEVGQALDIIEALLLV